MNSIVFTGKTEEEAVENCRIGIEEMYGYFDKERVKVYQEGDTWVAMYLKSPLY
ncbi:hypothetical protein [Atopococcus tabaci]|uniref:hypothetical protein n=1 Tax=Atopococcus tabaci TaxID=269774 RepID=UPI00240A192C|nr:hypothetical protein [Atopococcus tabaci]